MTVTASGESDGLGPRRLAWHVVEEVLRRRVPLDEVIAELGEGESLSDRDEALARAIATVTFRRYGTLVQALAERLDKGLPKDRRLLALLAVGAAQILFLDVPDHAAVDTAVRIAGSDRSLRPMSGLVNAVLRRVARERDAVLADSDPWRDTPDWLRERWTGAYGPERARAVAEANRQGATVDLTVKDETDLWADRVNGVLLSTGSIRLTDRTPVRALPGFEEGAWWVQDAAAALPARLLGAAPGERIADLCAAPGGKTAQLALSGAEVLAVDRSEKRLRRLDANLARLHLHARSLAVDAARLDEPPFDAVLLDAPCSATGTLRRHPDVAWIKSDADVAKLSDLQRRLLDKAAMLVRPGGRLVYCTCSLEPEEGEEQIADFLVRWPEFERMPVRREEVGDLEEAINPDGDLRTLPFHMPPSDRAPGGCDGFFAARLSRTK